MTVLTMEQVASLMEQQKPKLLRYAFRRYGLHPGDAEDVYQSMAVHVFTYADLETSQNPRGYLLTSFSNECAKFHRQRLAGRNRALPFSELDTPEQVFELTGDGDPVYPLLVKEGMQRLLQQQEELGNAMSSLSVPDRQLLYLWAGEHLPYAKIAERLGIDDKTVKMRLFRARRRAQQSMDHPAIAGAGEHEQAGLLFGDRYEGFVCSIIEGISPKFGRELGLRAAGLTYRQIAGRQEIPLETACSRIWRGRRALKESLDLP